MPLSKSNARLSATSHQAHTIQYCFMRFVCRRIEASNYRQMDISVELYQPFLDVNGSKMADVQPTVIDT